MRLCSSRDNTRTAAEREPHHHHGEDARQLERTTAAGTSAEDAYSGPAQAKTVAWLPRGHLKLGGGLDLERDLPATR